MGVSLRPDRDSSELFFHLPWAAWTPLWIYANLAADEVLDELDYQGGGSNDGHLISAEKARKIADILDERLTRGIRDDGSVLQAFRIDRGQRDRIQAWLDAGFEAFERAKAEGRQLAQDEIPKLTDLRPPSPPPLGEEWNDPEVARRILCNFEDVVRGFSGFCRASAELGGFRVW